MTLPWSKLPRALRGDWRLTQRSPDALAAFLLAWMAADDDGVIAPAGCVGAVEALATQLTTHRPGAPRAWAVEAVAECVDAGLLESLDDGDALRVVDWLSAPATPSEDAPTAVPTATRPMGTARPPGRPRKGAEPMSTNERTWRRRFARREGKLFRDVPVGVTWEQWEAEHPEAATKLRNGRNETTDLATKPCNETLQRNYVEGRAASETSESSETQIDEKTGEKSENPDARALQRNSATKLSAGRNETRRVVSLQTVEDLAPFDADTVLDRMRAASGDRLALMLSGKDERIAFAVLARDLLAEGHVSVEGLVRAASHAPHDPWVSKQGKLPLHRLMAKGGKLLLDLIAGSSACPACGGVPLASDAPHPDDDAVEAARRRYRTASTASIAPTAHGDAR